MTTTTFLFTDIEGSTRLWELHPEAMRSALASHDEITATHVNAHGGSVFKHMGDGAIAAFDAAGAAIDAAKAIQAALAGENHPDVGVLKVRMGIHSGEVEARDGDYFGPVLNRTARLMAAGHGGQVLVSLVAGRLAGNRADLVDLGEHRLRDLSTPERIFQVATDQTLPPLRTLDVAPNNLPIFPTSFVGRHRETREVTQLVGDSRLVTVTGVGGAGKTRLALQVAADTASNFPGGVWLVELAAVTDPDLVDGAVAEALGLAQEGTKTLRQSIIGFLTGRIALLVIDNCEHLITTVADLVEQVLRTTADTTVVTTSRELLGIPGEVAYGLRSLSLPGPRDPIGPGDVASYDALQLFIERAAAAKPDFHLDAASVAAVAEVCRRLDGMPLALELAASRVRTFPVVKIAELLDQRFRLLTGGSRTALPRQQTLAATIEWSYRLLDEREQALFRRLSTFAGGFTYEAAAEVVVGDPIDEFDVMEMLPSLVDKSLVVADQVGAQVRYRLLETIRQFALDLFEDGPEADAVRLGHARHFEALAQEAGRHIRGPDEAEWWGRIDAELDNLRLAMTWAAEHDHGELALSTASGFWRFWWFKGRWLEGARWVEQALDAAGDAIPDLLLAQGLLAYGSLVEPVAGEEPGAPPTRRDPETSLERSIAIYQRLHEEGIDPDLLLQGYPAALINLGAVMDATGRAERSLALMTEALAVSRAIGDTAGITVSLGNLAEDAVQRGDFDEARRVHDEALAVAESLGSNARLGDTWSQRWEIEVRAGDLVAAGEALRNARHHSEAADQPHLVAYLDVFLAVNNMFAGGVDASPVREALRRMVEHEAMVRMPDFTPDLLGARVVADANAGRDAEAAAAIGAFRARSPSHDQVLPPLDAVIGQVRARLGDTEFERLAAIGAGLDLEDAIGLLTD